jgi:hypothetical protein
VVALDAAGPGLGAFRQAAEQLSSILPDLRAELVAHRDAQP